MKKTKYRTEKRRLVLDRQVVRYMRPLSGDELVHVAGGASENGDPECSRDCVPH